MSTIRQDAWSEDEDLLLAETVLRHIREGSTQLVAFEEVGKTLSRTSAACGFRWNSLVRKKYDSAIILAKKQRKELQNQKKIINKKPRTVVKQKKVEELPADSGEEVTGQFNMNLGHIIAYLEGLKTEETVVNDLRHENQYLKSELEVEKKRLLEIEAECKQIKSEYESVKSEYRAMLNIMEKARKLVGTYDPVLVPEKVNE